MSIRKFLKTVGVRSQHEIEQAVSRVMAQGLLKGDESVPVRMTLRIGKTDLTVNFDSTIDLQ